VILHWTKFPNRRSRKFDLTRNGKSAKPALGKSATHLRKPSYFAPSLSAFHKHHRLVPVASHCILIGDDLERTLIETTGLLRCCLDESQLTESISDGRNIQPCGPDAVRPKARSTQVAPRGAGAIISSHALRISTIPVVVEHKSAPRVFYMGGWLSATEELPHVPIDRICPRPKPPGQESGEEISPQAEDREGDPEYLSFHLFKCAWV